jgi:hypothetical protein
MILIILYQIQSKINNMAAKNITKNSACACAGLFFISLSLILMTQIHFDSNINSQI